MIFFSVFVFYVLELISYFKGYFVIIIGIKNRVERKVVLVILSLNKGYIKNFFFGFFNYLMYFVF